MGERGAVGGNFHFASGGEMGWNLMISVSPPAAHCCFQQFMEMDQKMVCSVKPASGAQLNVATMRP